MVLYLLIVGSLEPKSLSMRHSEVLPPGLEIPPGFVAYVLHLCVHLDVLEFYAYS